MIDVSSTRRANRRALVAGLLCFAVLLAIGLLLDQQGVRFPSSLIGVLVAAGVLLAVVLTARGRNR